MSGRKPKTRRSVYIILNLVMIPVHAIAAIWMVLNFLISSGVGLPDVVGYGLMMNLPNMVLFGAHFYQNRDLKGELAPFVFASLFTLSGYLFIGFFLVT